MITLENFQTAPVHLTNIRARKGHALAVHRRVTSRGGLVVTQRHESCVTKTSVPSPFHERNLRDLPRFTHRNASCLAEMPSPQWTALRGRQIREGAGLSAAPRSFEHRGARVRS
jgi:hypothetical protein